jgi:hypothetical protein
MNVELFFKFGNTIILAGRKKEKRHSLKKFENIC